MNTLTPQIPTEQKLAPWYPPKTVLAIVAGMFLFSIAIYNKLPDMVPTHWGLSGEADAFSPKAFGAFFAPVLGLAIAILFPVLQRMDPKRESYANFQSTWVRFQIGIISFFAYIHVITVLAGLSPWMSSHVAMFITSGMGVLFILLGNSMGKIEQNWFVGVRTPWALSDPEIWRKSQRLGGLLFVLGGIAILIVSLAIQSSIALFVTFITIILTICIVPTVYSYMLAKKKSKEPSANN
ncbi:MAG: SdpI family protein [Candidatus Uhrbacteria bacterium]|nr:SdpI family protein [Candidatus Uhrbacteria bacterium]